MILHLIETGGPGGAEQMMLRLADRYARCGHRQMICLRKDGWLADEARKRGFDVEIIPLGRIPDLVWLARAIRLAKRRGVESIHAHEFAMNVHAALLGKLLRLPTVATVHGRKYYGDRAVRRQAYRFVSRLAHLVAVSNDVRAFLIEAIGIHPSRVSVIANGVDVERFRFEEADRSSAREFLGMSDNDLLIGTLGSYYPVKGQEFLIAAMPAIVARCPRARLIMAGQGPLEGALNKQAAELGLSGRVNVCGYVEDVRKFLCALDVFVLPSLSEGMPLALLESAASGRAIVATQVGGIPEIIKNGENGLLVPPGNASALAQAVGDLVTQAHFRVELGRRAAKTVSDDWSLQTAADSYLELLSGE